MNIDHLLNSAASLPTIDKIAVDEYQSKTDRMIALLNEKVLEREDIRNLIGQGNEQMMQDNHANHARFIYSIMKKPNNQVFVSSILWMFRTYHSHGFSVNYWSVELNIWLNILKDQLSVNSFNQIAPIYSWMKDNVHVFAEIAKEQIKVKSEESNIF